MYIYTIIYNISLSELQDFVVFKKNSVYLSVTKSFTNNLLPCSVLPGIWIACQTAVGRDQKGCVRCQRTRVQEGVHSIPREYAVQVLLV